MNVTIKYFWIEHNVTKRKTNPSCSVDVAAGKQHSLLSQQNNTKRSLSSIFSKLTAKELVTAVSCILYKELKTFQNSLQLPNFQWKFLVFHKLIHNLCFFVGKTA